MSSSTHHRHGDSKRHERARRILSFFLFLTVSLLSLSVCIRASFVSKGAIVNTLTSDTYVQGEYNSIKDYAHDLCDECSLPYDSVDKVITFDSVYKIQKAYINGILSASNEYTETTYKDYIADLGKSIKKETLLMLKQKNIDFYGKPDKAAARFSDYITKYVTKVTELAFTNIVKTVVTFGSVASIIAIAVFVVIATVFVLFIVSIGKKLYRAVRDIAYSFYAASLLNLLLVSGVSVVKHYKHLWLYPLYFSNAILEYVSRCIASVGVSSAVLFVIGIALTTAVWCMKRNENS